MVFQGTFGRNLRANVTIANNNPGMLYYVMSLYYVQCIWLQSLQSTSPIYICVVDRHQMNHNYTATKGAILP